VGSGELTEGSPSSQKQEQKTVAEIIDFYFPQYLALGMPYEVYWHGDPKLAKAYREADKLRLQRENQRLWLQGAYIYNIMVSVAPTYNSLKPHDPLPYMEHPIPITEKEVEEIEKQIDPKYVAEYKRIKGFRANPVAVFKDSRCGGCMMQLPSSTTGKILGASTPFVCENCGRILIIE
jgi:hypothetical protein